MRPVIRPAVPASVLIMIAGFVLAVVVAAGYTTYAIGSHSRQACAELRILATTKGAATRYDMAVRHAYRSLYALRCG
jgi:hypothetical protein